VVDGVIITHKQKFYYPKQAASSKVNVEYDWRESKNVRLAARCTVNGTVIISLDATA
jgi:hypothetical protein